MKITPEEKKLIIEAVELRKPFVDDHKKSLSAIDSILLFAYNPFLRLSSFEKAFLRGCVKEYCIYPNEELLKLSDYEVFQSSPDLYPAFNFVDTGLSLLKKLNDSDYSGYRSYESVLENVRQFSAIKTVYYSLSGRKIYKAGVVLKGKKGFKIEIGSADYLRFEVVELFRDQFMYEGTPSEILDKIRIFENESQLEENHTILAAILNPAGAQYAIN